MRDILNGIRIVEFSGIGPGPFCGMLLADLGADVIVIERPSDSCTSQPRPHEIVNRGKRSIIIDLKQPLAKDLALKLLTDTDALIEGMRPGVMERLGLGPMTCLEHNPALVYGRITGWGQSGPLSNAAGHDSNFTALAGALWFAGKAGTPQHAPPTVMGDIGGGALYLAIGILASILKARDTGRGEVIDAAIVDGTAHMLNLLLGMIAMNGGNDDRGVHMFDKAHWAGRSYLCSDDKWINLATLEPQFYSQLLGRLGLQSDERFVNGHMNPDLWPELTAALAKTFMSGTQTYWRQLLEGTDSCFAPVFSPSEASTHPHITHRKLYTQVDGVLQTRPAPRFSQSSVREPSSVPLKGQHTNDILKNAGLSPESIQNLKRTNTVLDASD